MILFSTKIIEIESLEITMSIFYDNTQRNVLITTKIKFFYVEQTLLLLINIFVFDFLNEFVLRLRFIYKNDYNLQSLMRFEFNFLH